MNLRTLVESGAFSDDKWTCGRGNCNQKAPYILVNITKFPRKGTVDFSGRCPKHKTENCITLAEFREMVLK